MFACYNLGRTQHGVAHRSRGCHSSRRSSSRCWARESQIRWLAEDTVFWGTCEVAVTWAHQTCMSHCCPTYQLQSPPKRGWKIGAARKLSKNVENIVDTFCRFLPCARKCRKVSKIFLTLFDNCYRFSTWPLSAGPFCGPLTTSSSPENEIRETPKPFPGKCRRIPTDSGFPIKETRNAKKRPIQGIPGNSFLGPRTPLWLRAFWDGFPWADENGQSWYVGHGGRMSPWVRPTVGNSTWPLSDT